MLSLEIRGIIMFEYFQNVLIYVFLYIPPLIFFIKYSLRRGVNRLLLFVVTILYLVLSIYTQNFLPFILVLIDIFYIKKSDSVILTDRYRNYSDISEDYTRYNFSIKSFKLLKGIQYAIATYGITIAVNIMVTIIILLFKLNLKEQEIVTELSKGSLNQLLYMIPIMIIFAPIVEEFTFRWLLFEHIFRPRVGTVMAAVISSIMFSLIHFNLRAFPVLMIIGFINCYMIHKKGYWYAVFNHLLFNSVSTFVMLYQKIS
jgi:hypothetical protein